MRSKNSVDMIECSGFNDRFCSAWCIFFSMLMYKNDRAGTVILISLHHFGEHTKCHGMPVMAACMDDSIHRRCLCHCIFFLYRQRVKVRSERDGFTRLAPFQGGNYPIAADICWMRNA